MLFKKIVSIFLAATIMLSMLALTVNAESVQNTEIFKVEVEAVSAASTVSPNPVIFNNGEEITVNVFASQNTGFTMLRMIIDFNENFLEAVDGKFSSTDIYSDGKLSLGEGFFEFSSFADFSVKTATGLLATITFVAKEDVCFTEDEFNASEIIKVYPYENNNGFCVNADFEELPLVSEVVPFAVHEISSGVVTNPTCLDEGYTTYHCELCDKDIVGNITDAAGHTPADKPIVENYVDPTCTVEGSYDDVIYCTICSAELSRTAMVVEPLGHDLVPHDSKAPTCTEIGWDTYNACSRCDYTTYVEKPALDHDLIHHEAKDPTCTEIGWDAYDTCSRCDYTTYKEIHPLGHNPTVTKEENRVEATCITDGSYDSVVYCSVCNEELSRENKTIKAPGHNLIHHDAKDATCTEIGWNAYETCRICDYTTYVEISALGHKYGTPTIVEPEYKKDGYTTHTCSVCNHEEKYDITPALTYILGDADGNETIDSDDAIYLLFHTLLPEEYAVNQKCDFDGDGDLDSDDAIYLLYHTLLLEKYPLHK